MLLSPARWGDRLGRCREGALLLLVPSDPGIGQCPRCHVHSLWSCTKPRPHSTSGRSWATDKSSQGQARERAVWMDAERSKQARQWVELTVRTKETDECKGEPRGQKRPAPLITLIHQLQQMMEYCSTYTFHQGLKVKVKALTPTLAIRK